MTRSRETVHLDIPAAPAEGPTSATLRPHAGPWRRLALALAGLAVAGYFLSQLGDWVSWELLQQQRQALESFVRDEPFGAAAVFFLAYVTVTGLSLPVGVWLSFMAGAFFGRIPGIAIASCASTTGACVAFLASRYLFREAVERRWGDRLAVLQRGVEAEGAYYLLALRLSPLVPFWLVNFGMGLTRMRLRTFGWVSQLGMLPICMAVVNAGAEMRQVHRPSDMLSPSLLVALSLAAGVPLAFRWLWHRRRTKEGKGS